MSNPAQGAVGAARVCHKEQMEVWTSEIAGDLSMGGWFREDISYDDNLAIRDTIAGNIRSIVGTAFALATPRTDSDEGTAGEDGDWAGTLARSVLHREGYAYDHLVNAVAAELRRIEAVGYTKGHEAGDAHRKASTPAPATPPGVPDSVRAVLIHACYGVHDEPDLSRRSVRISCSNNDGALAVRNWLLDLRNGLHTHPAGQSTGQGADEPCAWAGGNDTCYCRTCGEEYLYGRDDKPACPRKPAPDSPLTGDEGTEKRAKAATSVREALHKAVSKALHDNQFADGWPEMVDPVVDAVLAARPAAPEAQGAEVEPSELDITSAMIQAGRYAANLDDGTLARIYVAMRAVEWREARKPAPPSSGQGGR